MDVDADNFEQALTELERHLPNAAYISVDLEMTGIIGTPDTKVCGSDLPQEQYAKARKVIGRPFNIVQVGFCLFEEKEPGHFECRPFNIFVFPRQIKEHDANGKELNSGDQFLGLSASTALFLLTNGLDFNRWMGKGVNYTSARFEALLLEALSTLQTCNNSGGGDAASKGKVQPDRPADVELVENTMRQVAEFAAAGKAEMKLPQCNRFLALCLRQRIGAEHPQLVIEKRPNESNPKVEERWVVNASDDSRKEKLAETRNRFMAHIGFRRMWNLLKACQKPFVFHNGFFDLLFLFSALEGPLPSSLVDFKALVKKSFPLLFDTKILAESRELSGRLCSRSNLPELTAGLDERLQKARESREASLSVTVGDVEAATIDPYGGEAEAATCNASTTAESADGSECGVQAVEVTSDSKNGVAEAEMAATMESAADKSTKAEKPVAADAVAEEISFSLPAGFDKYSAESGPGDPTSFHNAGYDSYQTGRIFTYYRAVLGDLQINDFVNRIFLMFSKFELNLSQVEDHLSIDGIARFLHQIDNKFLNNRTFLNLLKPVLQEGKRRVDMRWSGDYHSMLLILHGHDDTAKGTPGREACEKCLDGLLQEQQSQDRLQFTTLEAHMEEIAAASKGVNGKRNGESELPEAKRQRVD